MASTKQTSPAPSEVADRARATAGKVAERVGDAAGEVAQTIGDAAREKADGVADKAAERIESNPRMARRRRGRILKFAGLAAVASAIVSWAASRRASTDIGPGGSQPAPPREPGLR